MPEHVHAAAGRSCVDKLLFGHLQTGNPASSTEQLDSLLGSQWQAHCSELGLPPIPATRAGWASWAAGSSDAFAAESVAATVNGLIDRQLGYLPDPEGMAAAEQWVPTSC